MLLWIMSGSVLYAQTKAVSGIVLERGKNTRIGEVNVRNLNTQSVVQTSSFGVFFIEASIGDSLSFTKIGYGPVKTVLYTTSDILIDMQAGLTIESVVVSRMSKEAELNSLLNDYRKKGVYNGGSNKVGTYLNSPATALYNLFGKDAKNAKRFSKFVDRELEETQVDRKFNRTLVAELTELEGDDLQSFMDLYRPSFNAVEHWGQYDLMNYIKNSFNSWDKNGRPKSARLPKLEIPPQEK